MKRTTIIRASLLVILIGTIVFATRYRESMNAETLTVLMESFGIWAPVIFITLFALATVAFLPGMVFALAGGVMFGPVLGTLYNLAGATIGAVLAFVAARYMASDWVREKTGPKLDRIIRGVDDEGWRFVVFTRLVPLFPFNLLNYAFGLTRIPLMQYASATAVAMIPGAFAYTYLGHAGREAAAGSETAIRNTLIAIGLLAAVMFLPRLVKRILNSKFRIVTENLKQRRDDGEDILVLDVRDAEDYSGEGGHVPGAKNIPLADLQTSFADLEDWRQRPMAVICRTNNKSGKAAELLRAEGFSQVLLVDDGMIGWSNNGFKTV